MKKFYTLLSILIYFSFNLQAQQYYTITNSLKDNHSSVSNVYPIANSKNENLSVFIDDKKSINAYIYNKDLDRIDSLPSKRLPKFYNEVIGHIQKENKTILFFKNRINTQIGAVIFDFKTRTTKQIELSLKLKKGTYLEGLNKNNKFYLITVVKDKSILKLYEFEHIHPKTHIISLDDYSFRIAGNKTLNLYEMLKNLKKMNPNPVELRKIETDLPVSMELAGAMNKIYETDKGFALTLDKSIYETYLIDVDFNNYKAEIRRFEKPKFSVEDRYFSKSFLLDDNIYQVVGNSDELYFEAKKRQTKKILKKLHVNRKEQITFKNTDFIVNGGYHKTTKTSKFLKKIDNEDITVSVEKKDNQYIISLGSYIDSRSDGTVQMMAPGGGSFSVSDGLINNISSYLSYAHGKSIKIKCLFDSDFNHIEGKVPENIFDRIKNYSKRLQNPIAESVFKWNDRVYYGYYNKENESYRITKFTN